MRCSELSMSSFRAAIICQFPLLLVKFPLEMPFLGIGSKWHQLPSAKLHPSSSPLMTEKWNGTFNYYPYEMGRNPFWNSQKNCFVFQSLNFAKLHRIPTGCCHVILIYGPIGIGLMTEKWNGTFNYCPCVWCLNPFWNSQKFIK